MADIGNSAAFTFNSVTFGVTDCLQSTGITDAINEVIYQCNGMEQGKAGTRTATFTVSLFLSKTDTAKLAAVAPGTTAADFEYHPAGDTATYIEVTSSDAYVVSAPFNAAVNSMITLDVTIRLNQITIGAAA